MGSLGKIGPTPGLAAWPLLLSLSMRNQADSQPVNRRAFVRSAVAGVGGALLLPASLRSLERKKPVVIGSFFPQGPFSSQTRWLARGYRLGSDEAMRASALFAQPLQSLRISYDPAADIRAQVSRMKSLGVHVIIGGGVEHDCRLIGEACTAEEVVYLNPSCRADSLRRNSCSRFVFHVEASDAMYAAATASSGAQQILLWHPALTRYGASQLNDRYRAQFGEPMSGAAWAAWFAFKVAWETGLRTSAAGAAATADAMSRDSTQFDGHKGAPLSFRSWDHQLRQPLYAVTTSAGKERVTDVPDLAKSSRPARELLDTLGDRTSDHACVGEKQ
jgi:ABC-type branched-subunit amino acid transport system substrate-binding protein